MNIRGVLETALYANDLEEAARFFGDVLGLELLNGDADRDLFYRCGDAVLIIFNPELTCRPTSKAPTHGATGPGHLAFNVPQHDLDAWRQRLQDHDVEIETEVTWHNGIRSMYFRDPAGNSIELTSPSLWFGSDTQD